MRTSPAGPERRAPAPPPWRPLSVATDPAGPATTAPLAPTLILPEGMRAAGLMGAATATCPIPPRPCPARPRPPCPAKPRPRWLAEALATARQKTATTCS